MNEQYPTRRCSSITGQVLLAVLVITISLLPVSTAQANLLDRAKDIYQLPENFDKIQQEYAATKQQLEEQKSKLAEAMQQSKRAEEQLLAQNSELQQRNAALQQRIQAMEQAAAEKENRNKKVMYIVSAAVALALLYLVSGRLFRFSVWRRQKRRLHK